MPDVAEVAGRDLRLEEPRDGPEYGASWRARMASSSASAVGVKSVPERLDGAGDGHHHHYFILFYFYCSISGKISDKRQTTGEKARNSRGWSCFPFTSVLSRMLDYCIGRVGEGALSYCASAVLFLSMNVV